MRPISASTSAGLIAAARKVPEALHRALMRNLFTRVPQRHQKRLARELVAVLHAESLEAATATVARNRASDRPQ